MLFEDRDANFDLGDIAVVEGDEDALGRDIFLAAAPGEKACSRSRDAEILIDCSVFKKRRLVERTPPALPSRGDSKAQRPPRCGDRHFGGARARSKRHWLGRGAVRGASPRRVLARVCLRVVLPLKTT